MFDLKSWQNMGSEVVNAGAGMLAFPVLAPHQSPGTSDKDETMPSDFNAIAAQCVTLWERIAGRAIDARSYSVQMTQASQEITRGCDLIRSAVDLDDSFSTIMVTRSIFERLATAELLADCNLTAVSELATLLSLPKVTAAAEEYFDYCSRAIKHYRPSLAISDLHDFIRQEASVLNLDAYLSMDRLTKLTAFDGPTGPGTDPALNRFIYGYSSLEELLQHARVMPEGFSLCAILSGSISDSFFVLVVKGGGHVTLLTDKGTFAHPLQQEMMRGRNDRYNQFRIEGSHFPYSLLNIIWADNGRRAVAGPGTALAVSESPIPSIGSLADLAADELLWLHLLIEQCRLRYLQNRLIEPRLALGSQLQLNHEWLGDKGLPTIPEVNTPLEVKTSTELSTDFMHTLEPNWVGKRQPNLWMERRFADKVPSEALYIPEVAMNEQPILLEHDGSGVRIERRTVERLPAGGLPNQINLRPISRDLLATSEQIKRDAHYVARSNQAAVIRVLARQDYQERKVEMLEWFYRKAARHLPNILEALLTCDSSSFQLDHPKFTELRTQLGFSSFMATDRRKIRFEYIPARKQPYPRKTDGPSLAKALKLVSLRNLCVCSALNDNERAQVFISLPVTNALDLVNLTGVSWDKLPEELQHFGMPEVGGNSILERLDPLQSLTNPWRFFAPRFVVPVGLNGLKAFRRVHGMATPKADDLKDL
ncbi:TPA: hypothetical protein ACKRQV_001248 [Pseudomonas aeruginosa]